MTRPHRLAASIATNYLALGAQVLFLIALTPFVVHQLGAAVYGGWALVLSVSGYLRLLDGGLGQATARFVAAADDDGERRRVIATNVAMLAPIALLGVAVALLLGSLAGTLFDDLDGLGAAIAIGAASTALQLPLAAWPNGLFGLHRIVARNVFVIARMVLSGAAIVVAVLAGGGLVAFVTAGAIAELGVAVACVVWSYLRVPALRARLHDVRRRQIRPTLQFAMATFGITVATQIAFYSDSIVIGVAETATMVAVYAVAMRIADGCSMLLSQFADVFLPTLTGLHVAEDHAASRRLVRVGTRVTLAVALPLLSIVAGLGGPLIHLWVGDGFQEAWTPLVLLCAAAVFGAPARFGILWMIGAARHGRIAMIALADAAANLALSIVLVGPLGIDGVALSTFLTIAVSNGVIVPILFCRELGLSAWRDHLRPIATGLLAFAPLAVAARLVAPHVTGDAVATLGAAVLALALGIALTLLVVLTGDDRAALRRLRGGATEPTEAEV